MTWHVERGPPVWKPSDFEGVKFFIYLIQVGIQELSALGSFIDVEGGGWDEFN